MDKNRLISLIQNPELTTSEDTLALARLVRTFPFFQSAHLLLLYNQKKFDKDLFSRQLQESAVFVADRSILFKLIKSIESNTVSIQEEIKNTIDQNLETADEKLQSKGESLDFQMEENLPILIIDSIPDTDSNNLKGIKSELLEIDEEPRPSVTINTNQGMIGLTEKEKSAKDSAKADNEPNEKIIFESSAEPSKTDIIDKFIQEDPVFKPKRTESEVLNEDVSKESITEDEELVTETLALIYTSQKLFPKAISVYEKLILKFPEKKAYFASRIEELKKNIK